MTPLAAAALAFLPWLALGALLTVLLGWWIGAAVTGNRAAQWVWAILACLVFASLMGALLKGLWEMLCR